MAHCHCTLCQKNAGAAFVTWAGFAEADAVIEDEAVTLAQELSTDESSSFVNGLLGRLLELKPRLALGSDPA